MGKEHRLVLGSHIDQGKDMASCYSRDAMGPSLRVLGCLLDQVRGEHFVPDATRSGRWQSYSQASEFAGGEGGMPGIALKADDKAKTRTVAEVRQLSPSDEDKSRGEAHTAEDSEDGARVKGQVRQGRMRR